MMIWVNLDQNMLFQNYVILLLLFFFFLTLGARSLFFQIMLKGSIHARITYTNILIQSNPHNFRSIQFWSPSLSQVTLVLCFHLSRSSSTSFRMAKIAWCYVVPCLLVSRVLQPLSRFWTDCCCTFPKVALFHHQSLPTHFHLLY